MKTKFDPHASHSYPGEPDTYGKTPAALTLYVESLKLPKRDRQRIGRFLCHYNRLLRAVPGINKELTMAFYNLIVNHAKDKIKSMKLPKTVKSYLRNTAIGAYRDKIKEVTS